MRPATRPPQDAVCDEAGERAEEQRVHDAVCDTAPEELEPEVDATGAISRVGTENVDELQKADQDAEADTPRPGEPDDTTDIDMFGAYVRDE